MVSELLSYPVNFRFSLFLLTFSPTSMNSTFSAQAPLKLTSSNYLLWKIQFEILFIGYDLLRYIDGSKPCPPKTLTTNNIVTPNAAYNIWVCQDQLIVNALIGSLSPTIISFITRANTHPKPSHNH
jgi:hypothetical protein